MSEEYSRITFASCGDMKITAVKIVRELLGPKDCGLKEAKEIVEGSRHSTILTPVAEEIKKQCEELGAKVFVRPCDPPVGIIRGVDFSKGKKNDPE